MHHENNTVRIIGPDNRHVGTGILVGPSHILTCMHVVPAAQGRPDTESAEPEQGVRFDLPLLPQLGPSDRLSALPLLCKPVLSTPRVGDLDDIAVLRIEDPAALPAGAAPAPLRVLEQPYNREAAAFGFQRWDGDTVRLSLLAMNASGAVQIEQRPGYPEVGPGFSGAAVRDVEDWSVIGMLVRRDPQRWQARTAYMITAAKLLRVLDEAGVPYRAEHKPEQAAPEPPAVPPDERLLWIEVVRLLTGILAIQDAKVLRDNAFRHLPNDPSQRLRTDTAPSELATDWVRELWEAKCMDGHSPLYRLLEAGYKDRRPPRVQGFSNFQEVLAALDAPCRGSGQPTAATSAEPSGTPRPLHPPPSVTAVTLEGAEGSGVRQVGLDETGASGTSAASGIRPGRNPDRDAGYSRPEPSNGQASKSDQGRRADTPGASPTSDGQGNRSGLHRLLRAAVFPLIVVVPVLLLYLWPWEPEPSKILSDEPAVTEPAEAPAPPLTLAINEIAAAGADVTINFLQPDDDGRYRPLITALGEIPEMHSGDWYRIRVAAARDAYLYIIHFDTHGQVRELLQLDRDGAFAHADDRNRLSPRDSFLLPGPNRYGPSTKYELDDNPGLEHIHFVLSPEPRPGLVDSYRERYRSGERKAPDPATLRAALRGIPSATRGAEPTTEPGYPGSQAPVSAERYYCPPESELCQAELVFRHLGGSAP